MASEGVMTLGRFGDVIISLPIAHRLAEQAGQPTRFYVSRDFSSIMDGVSYVAPVVIDLPYNNLPEALRLTPPNVRVAQYHTNPNRSRQTKSFQSEAWRLAGMDPNLANSVPIFDRRSPERERALIAAIPKPYILFCGFSHSSPFPKAESLLKALQTAFPCHYVYDIGNLRAERVYDLIGLMDEAELLVTVDTMHLHLSRASKVPSVVITNNGWYGSLPPPNCVSWTSYASVTAYNLVLTCSAALGRASQLLHVVSPYGENERQTQAMATWENPIKVGAETINQVLASHKCSDRDVILWTNNDIQLNDELRKKIHDHVSVYGCASFHRNEEGHVGRDGFAFRADVLAKMLPRIPRFYLGYPMFDLVIAAMIREYHGLRKSTLGNMAERIFPAEIPGFALPHEPHKSEWVGRDSHPKYQENRKNALDWTRRFMPSLAL